MTKDTHSPSPDCHLQANLSFLESHANSSTIRSLTDASPSAHLELDTSGETTSYCYRTAEKTVQLHSKRDPKREAERQAQTFFNDTVEYNGMLVVLGIAGMYHLEALSRHLGPDASLFIADLNPDMVKTLVLNDDLTILRSMPAETFHLSVSASPVDIAADFREQLSKRPLFDLRVFVHPATGRLFPKPYQELEAMIVRQSRCDVMNRSTVAYLSAEWLQHSIVNLPRTVTEPPINGLKDRFKDRAGIMVAAGPSLNNSLPFLKQAASQVPVFAVGNALRPLLNAGICPDFVVAVDSDPKTLGQYSGSDNQPLYLLTTHIMLPQLLSLFEGRSFLFSTGAVPGFDHWLARAAALPDSLATGGTVAVTAIEAALYCGCKNVFFFGFDLCFSKDGTTHATKSIYDGVQETPEHLVRVAGNYQEWVYTKKQFATYVEMVNRYLASSEHEAGATFYNVTDGGARFGNAVLVRPEDFQQFVCSEPFDKKDFVAKIYKEAKTNLAGSPEPLIRETTQTIEEMETFMALSQKGLNYCLEWQEQNAPDLAAFTRLLDDVDCQLKQLVRAKSLITDAAQAVIMRIHQTISDCTSNDDYDGMFRENASLYRHFSQTADWLNGLLENTLDRLNKQWTKGVS